MSDALYHGTRAPFGRGGYVFPGDDHGRSNADRHGLAEARSGRVYVTPDFDLARDYALAASGRARPRVLTVVPCSALTVDDSTVGGDEQESFSCEFAKVIAVTFIEEPAV